MVGDRAMEAYFSMEVEFNVVNSVENRGHSRTDKGCKSLPRYYELLGSQKYGRNQMQRGLKLLQTGWIG